MKVKLKVTRKGRPPKVIAEEMTGKVGKAMKAVTALFVTAAKRRCPVSGAIKAGWVMVKAKRGYGFTFKKVRLPEAGARIPGRLRASIIGRAWQRGGHYFGSCGFTAPHGVFVEFGTSGPSAVIRPRKKRALAWYGPDGEVFVRKFSRGGPIRVGTERKPREASSDPWDAAKERKARRQSMPFLRPAWYIDTLPEARKRFAKVLGRKRKGGKTIVTATISR